MDNQQQYGRDRELSEMSTEEIEKLRAENDALRKKDKEKDAKIEELRKTNTRIIDVLVDLYTKKNHFIYELIQNAEDVMARDVLFVMYDDRLELLHDGLPFTDSNLEAITNPAKSDKQKIVDENHTPIGKFGIGFLATYTICNNVKLYSKPENYREPAKLGADTKPFANEIHGYTELKPISEETLEPPYTTRFVFPFFGGRHYETLDLLRKDLSDMLKELGADVMLYLKNIRSVKYIIYDNNGNISSQERYSLKREKSAVTDSSLKDHTIITSQGTPGNSGEISKYIMYSKDVAINDKTFAVDLVFGIEKNGDRVDFVDTGASEKHRCVSVYFPTRTESKLKFMIQAPFATTPNRESVPETKENKQLVAIAADLLREVVVDVKKRGWLSLDFLNILPYEDQPGDWLLRPLYNKSVKMFGDDEILPTIDGDYASKKNAYIAREKDFTKFFEGKFLCALVNNEKAKWMPVELTETSKTFSKLHGFLTETIKVNEISAKNMPAKLRNPHRLWDVVDDEWLVCFYNWIANHKDLRGKDGDLASVPFIKTSGGIFAGAYEKKTLIPKLYRIPNDESYDRGGFIFVDKYITDKCDYFLKVMGINEPNTYDYFVEKLKSNGAEISEDEELSQIKQAIRFLKDADRPEVDVTMFRSKLTLRYINTWTGKKSRGTLASLDGGRIYFAYDERDNRISYLRYFDGVDKWILDEDFYGDHGISGLSALKKLGVCDTVVEPRDNNYLGQKKSADTDIFKKELNFCLIDKVILNKMSREKSLTIWYLLKTVEIYLSDRAKSDDQPVGKIPVCTVVEILREGKWLYKRGESGVVYHPYDISKNDLDESYGSTDQCANLCELLMFKKDKTEELFAKIKSLPDNERKRLLDQIAPELEICIDDVDEENTEFPYDSEKIKSPEHYRILIDRTEKDYNRNRIPVKYDARTLSVRTSRGDDRRHIKVRYEGFCQMCKQPNKLWEVAELFNKPKYERKQMNLSLCPNCAAKYRLYRNDKGIMSDFRNNILAAPYDVDEPQARINDETIRFTQTHLVEIQTLLKLEDEIETLKYGNYGK